MGVLDRLKGIRKPKEGVAPVPVETLTQKLLALNGEQVPFTIAPAPAGTGADLVAEWKIVDAAWYEIFAKASLKKTHKVYLALHAEDLAVRVLDESWEVEWRAGVPTLNVSAEWFRGRTVAAKEFGQAYAFKGPNPLDFGEVYNYRFDVSEMKDPIAEIVTGAGWSFQPVVSKRKLTG